MSDPQRPEKPRTCPERITGTSTFDFRVLYSRKGKLHRWRLFSYGMQIDTGEEKTIEEAREASRLSKRHYMERCSNTVESFSFA